MTELYKKAEDFARKAHEGQKRKSTNEPYIVHPLEVAQILRENGAPELLQIAGLLHDTLEDTATTTADIRNLFGPYILKLVQAESEDKSKTWEQRKLHTISQLPKETRDVQLICLADKLSNVRSLLKETQRQGDIVWTKFKRGKADQGWYYCGIRDALRCLNKTKMWQEYDNICKQLFD